MTYGVKLIRTVSVGNGDQRFYEEIILKVNADSFDDAYSKAEAYAQNNAGEYRNTNNEIVRTIKTEAVDCFLAFEEEDSVQELYSSFYTNSTALSEDEFYRSVTTPCEEDALLLLRNQEFNI